MAPPVAIILDMKRTTFARRALVASLATGGVLVVAACGGTYKQAHEFQGQVYYTEERAPNVGERFAMSATHDCSGGVRDDDRALRLVPSKPGCPRQELTVDYTPEGIHRVEACNERWKIRCSKSPGNRSAQPPNFPQGPLDCVVDCVIEDHFAATP